MAYEEASVAGETPDRSKQRKSSGNPTAAESSAPAPDERDPRLAMTRETPQAREDHATAVFSTKAVNGGAGDGAKAGETSGPASGSASEPASGSASEETAGAASEEAEEASEGAPKDAPKGTSEEAAEESAEAVDVPDTSDGSGAADSASGADAPAGDAPSGGAANGEANGDARLRAAVAAWVAGSDDEDPDAGETSDDSASKSSTVDGKTDGETAAGKDVRAASSDAPAGEDTGAADAAEAKGAAKGDAPAKDASVADDAKSTDDSASPKVDQATAVFTTVTPKTSDAKAADPKADASAGDESGAKGDAAEPKADAPAKAAPAAKAPESTDDSKSTDEPGSGPGSTDEPKSTGVDQATAVFKALSPKAGGAKAVDQPTTMLKLGDHKPGGGKDTEAKPDAKPGPDSGEPAPKPEADAERTSKFVALKPLDEPSSKPSKSAQPAAGAAAAGAAAGAAASKADAPAKPAAQVPPPAPVERTTQQPLPPKPPLDLLAELTNTPPPAETPVRTAVRRVKIWTPLVLLLIVVFAVVQAVRPLPTPTLKLTAEESVSFEGGKPTMPWPGEGQAAMDVNGIGTFGTSGDQKPVPIASIAKVMTVYLILRDHPLEKGKDGPKIPVDAAAQKHYETGKPANESVVKVTEGQKISQYEALQAVMLPSANNVAKLLARWDTKSDSEDEFVAKMNKTAKELGMKNTHYTDPSGLDKTTVSTAEDLVKLGRAAMENPVFNEISRQPSYVDLNGDKQKNFFGLIPTVAIGIKTGTTTAAGGNILFAAEQVVDGKPQTIIGATLGQYGDNGVANIDEVTRVTEELIKAGKGALKSKKIVKKGDVVGQVDDGMGGTTPVVATKDVSAVGWSGLTVKLELDTEKGKTPPHSAKAGTKVGVLSVGDGKGGAVEVPVALQSDLSEPGLGAKLKRVG